MPVVTLVLGTSAGHGALSGVFVDLIIMARGASMFAAGPPLVEAALGLRVTPDALGGAEMHAAESGVAHNLAASEDEAFEMARRFLSSLPTNDAETLPRTTSDAADRRLDDLLDVIPRNVRRGYDMHEVLVRLVDEGTCFEVQPRSGRRSCM